MTKFEFLGDLSRLIADLPQEEVEQAMEYYEDYFADAGPEKEQEIIRDFISPAYIAEQLREASHQRQQASAQATFQEEEQKATAARNALTQGKPQVFSRKLAAQAQKRQMSSAAPIPQPQGGSQPQAQTAGSPQQQAARVPQQQATGVPQQQAARVPQQQATGVPQQQAARAPQQNVRPTQATAPGQQMQAARPAQPARPSVPQKQAPGANQGMPGSMPQNGNPQMRQQATAPGQAPVPPNATPGKPAQTAPPQKKEDAQAQNKMRNSIFRDDSDDDKTKEEELARRNKTKVDIKAINSATSQVDKKTAKERAKQRAAEQKEINAELYSSSKKTMILVVLLITSPIWLALVGIIVGLFAAAAIAVVGGVVFGIASIIASLGSILLAVVAITTMKMSTFVFAAGCVLFLFAAGIGLFFLSFKLVTRFIPDGYFNVIALYTAIKAKLSHLALK